MIDALWNPNVLVFLGGALCIVGALWASYRRGDFERQLREKNEEIIGLSKDVMVKNEQIIELTKDAKDSIIGGSSFCFMKVFGINPETNVGLLAFVHQGKYPLYDVNARIYDLQKEKTINNPTNIDEFLAVNTRVNLGGIPAGASTLQGKFSLGMGDRRGFNIFFDARNGFFMQCLQLRKVNGKWYYAIRVKRGDKIIHEDIEPGFPVDAVNIADWDQMP